jgi:hypothetical protein
MLPDVDLDEVTRLAHSVARVKSAGAADAFAHSEPV